MIEPAKMEFDSTEVLIAPPVMTMPFVLAVIWLWLTT